MKTKHSIPADKAIKDAIKLGFRIRFVHNHKKIQSHLTGKNYQENEFAVVRSYPVNLVNGRNGIMEYIVLNSGTLGFILEEVNEKSTIEDTHKQTENILEDIYSY